MSVTDHSLASALTALARSSPMTVSIHSPVRTLTAAELSSAVGRLAADLAAGGVRRGDRVAHVGRNSPGTLMTVLACSWLGAVAVPLSFRLAPAELAGVLAHCGAHTVVVSHDLVAAARTVAPTLDVSRWIDDTGGDRPCPPGWDSMETLLAYEPAISERGEPTPLGGDDLAVLLYTSGTTGRPKGVMLTYGNLLWSTRNMESVTERHRGDVTLAVAPMFHVGGLNALTLSTLTGGGTVVVRPAFDPQTTLDDLRDGAVTSIFGVPAMYAAVARLPEFTSADLSGVRTAIVAGALVPAALVEVYQLRGLHLQTSWGMTETAPAVTCVPADRTMSKPGSAGRPLPYSEVVLRGRDGSVVTRPGRAGEITVRGPNVTPGYWDDPESTAAVLSPDGWLRTGDLAHWDEDGFLTIVGRCTDMINTGGEKVFPAEVEQALSGLPGVSDVVVLGVPDETWGETVAAVFECSEPVSADQARAFAATSIARHKLPRVVLCLPELPRNAVGKVDRCRMRDILAEHRSQTRITAVP